MNSEKCICRECNERLSFDQLMESPHPFDGQDVIHACPKCKSIDCFDKACDEDGCWEVAHCGTPTPNGYRVTCCEHMPSEGATR